MKMNYGQLGFEDVNDEYQAFVNKFKPVKNTDDCYTPEPVYQAVLDYCVKRYGIDPKKVVRPFWPGGDYLHEEYPDGCCVVDNPPFSIITQIVKDYMANGIRFFLFAPYLTNFRCAAEGVTHIITSSNIVYHNGADVNTSFVTNMEPDNIARSAPDLRRRIADVNVKINKSNAMNTVKYIYPDCVLSATMLGRMAVHGAEFVLKRGNGKFIHELDSQFEAKKSIFGGGFLMSTKATKERAEA